MMLPYPDDRPRGSGGSGSGLDPLPPTPSGLKWWYVLLLIVALVIIVSVVL